MAGRILPTRRELQQRIHELESPRGAAKIVIAVLEQLDLPDTAKAIREIFGVDP